MEFMNFLAGNGLFLVLAVILVVVYFVNKRKR